MLKPGGELHIADCGKAQNAFMRGAFFLVQLLDDNDAKVKQNFKTIFGTLTIYTGTQV